MDRQLARFQNPQQPRHLPQPALPRLGARALAPQLFEGVSEGGGVERAIAAAERIEVAAERVERARDVALVEVEPPRPPPAESGGGGATTFANRARIRAAKPWTIGEAQLDVL